MDFPFHSRSKYYYLHAIRRLEKLFETPVKTANALKGLLKTVLYTLIKHLVAVCKIVF